jgi:Zn-dependent alcohol dehydrogenase
MGVPVLSIYSSVALAVTATASNYPIAPSHRVVRITPTANMFVDTVNIATVTTGMIILANTTAYVSIPQGATMSMIGAGALTAYISMVNVLA